MVNPLVKLVTMDFPYSLEIVCLAMSIQGSMSVRNGPNKTNKMHWFHAFVKSTLTSYAGATFTNIFMGRPTSMLSNDIFFGSCILGYIFVNCMPYDIGYRIFDNFVGMLLISVFSQVFRVSGIYGFSDVAYQTFVNSTSSYYPTPLFGPILFPSILGNMGGFLWNGFDGYLDGGMPWLFQQGISCSTFYHLYAHDVSGWMGIGLRGLLKPMAIRIMIAMGAEEEEENENGNGKGGGCIGGGVGCAVDDVLFARFVIGMFMVLMSILHMPQLLGPKFSPFSAFYDAVSRIFGMMKKRTSHPNTKSGGNGGGNKKSKKKNQ